MALSRKKKIIIAVSVVLVLGLVIIISVFASRKDEPEVTTIKIDVRPELRQTVTASGEVRPVRYIKLTSEVPGRIEEIYVTAAEQGLVVAEASVASARQQLVALQNGVEHAQVDLNTAQRELKRNTDLIEAGVASRFEYDAARDRYDQAKIALETSKANLESQKIAVKEAIERANQQRLSVQEAKTSIKS